MIIPTKNISLSSGKHTYLDLGEGGETLVMIHGLSFKQGLYPLINKLRSHFRIIVPDLPFLERHGFPFDHTVENYIRCIIELI